MHVREQHLAVSFDYPVVFTQRLFAPGNAALANVLRRAGTGRHRALFVVDGGVAEGYASLAPEIVAYAACHADALELVRPPLIVPGGEACKNDPEAVARLHRLFLEHRVDRHAFVLAIGGGALLDMVGYAAATAHRGIRTVRVPTTTLAQGDAGVGVKCGVNALGVKNFLGAFAPPFAVLVDSAFLAVQPARERTAGMAEAVKVALVRDARFFQWLEAHAPALAQGQMESLTQLVRRSAELHLDHIARGGDPFERGSARPLDFGHWAAHKLETLSEHRLRHGEAVAIGIALDAHVSQGCGLLDETSFARIVALLEALGLPLWDEALATARGGRLVVLDGLEEFRQHLGGALCVTLLGRIGAGVEIGAIDPRHVRDAVGWLARRASRYAVTRAQVAG